MEICGWRARTEIAVLHFARHNPCTLSMLYIALRAIQPFLVQLRRPRSIFQRRLEMAKRTKSVGETDRDELLDAIGHRIKVARVQAQLTPKELAVLLKTTSSWIYLAEDGQQNFQISSLRRISETLNISLRDLLPEGLESGPEFDRMQEAREISQTLIAQLTEAIGSLHRLNAVIDQRRGSNLGQSPPKPKKDS